MPNLSALLKQEIARVARKELRSEVAPLQKSAAGYRRQIAALRRQLAQLERQLRALAKANKTAAASVASDGEESAPAHRFSAKGLAKLRQRLGISAASMGLLLGVSGLSVYKWESGKTRPRKAQIEKIAQLRGVGKREALARLEEIQRQAASTKGARGKRA